MEDNIQNNAGFILKYIEIIVPILIAGVVGIIAIVGFFLKRLITSIDNMQVAFADFAGEMRVQTEINSNIKEDVADLKKLVSDTTLDVKNLDVRLTTLEVAHDHFHNKKS
jgi:hypothetical protein